MKKVMLPFLVASLLSSCQQNDKITQQPGPNDISEGTAHEMVRDYGNPIPMTLPRRSTGKPAKNTRAIWLDLTTLLPIFERIIKDEHGDGIRIYFGKYKDPHHQTDSHQHDQEYSIQNTIIVVSTHKVGNHHYDYYTDGRVAGEPFNKSLDNFAGKRGFIFTPPQNKGELTPPGDDEGAFLLQP